MTGKELKLRIDKLGMTQVKLAELMAVKPQTVNAILTAKDVRTSTVERIAAVTNMPISFFFDEEPDRNHVVASGDGSVAQLGNNNVAGNVADVAVLQERVKSLEKLVAEKERLIKVYEKVLENK